MISSSDREAIVYVAELAKEAKRYEELAKEISKLAKMDLELTEYERNLLSIGYMNMVYARRTSLRTMSSIEQKQKMVAELVDICEEILYVIDNHLIPWHTGADSMVSYYKMKGDYNRCLAELKTGDDVKTFSYRSQYAYEVATNTAESELPSTHPTRLCLTRNIEVLFNEILDSPKSGMAEQAYDALDIQEEDDKSKSDPKEKQGPSISEEIVSQQDDRVFATKDRETFSQVSSEVVKRLKQQKPPPGEVDREQGSQEIVSRQDDCVAAATRGGETRSQVSSKVVKGLKQKPAEVSREGGSIVNSASIGVDSAHGRVGYAVVGLYSLGQTCFFNSVIQNLLAIDSLRVYFCKVEKDVGPVSGALRKIFLQTNIGTGLREPIVPRSLFECLRIKAPQFRENQQDDSHELLRCLLDLLSHEEIQPRKHSKFSPAPIPGPTFVNDLFGGRISSTITCTKCQHSSTCYEAYLDLSLTVPAKRDQLVILSVEGCLALFVEPEILSNDNGWHCENCSRVMREQRVVDSENLNVTTDATKRLLIDIAPPILTIHLKRFSKDAQGLLSKLDDDVSFREMIDLEPYMDTRCSERGGFTYRLVGVVEHRGVMEGGHYIAYVRGTKDNGDCVWYCTNDIRVREVSLEKVLCSKAYILFYERTRGSSDYHVH